MKSSTNCPFQSLSLVMSYVLVIWQIIARGECSVLQASICVPITDNSKYILDLLMYNLEIEGLWATLPELHNLIICAQTAAPWVMGFWGFHGPGDWGSAVTPATNMRNISILMLPFCCPEEISLYTSWHSRGYAPLNDTQCFRARLD